MIGTELAPHSACGASVWLGYTDPSTTTVETFLRQTGLGYYRKGTCS